MELKKVYIGRERILKWDIHSKKHSVQLGKLCIWHDNLCMQLVDCDSWRIYYSENVVIIDGVKIPFETCFQRFYHKDEKGGVKYYIDRAEAKKVADSLYNGCVIEIEDELGGIYFVKANTYKFYEKAEKGKDILREFMTLKEARSAARKMNQDKVVIFREEYGGHTHEVIYPNQYR